MKDTHLQEFLEAETAWKEKTDALQLKVQNCQAAAFLPGLNPEAMLLIEFSSMYSPSFT